MDQIEDRSIVMTDEVQVVVEDALRKSSYVMVETVALSKEVASPITQPISSQEVSSYQDKIIELKQCNSSQDNKFVGMMTSNAIF